MTTPAALTSNRPSGPLLRTANGDMDFATADAAKSLSALLKGPRLAVLAGSGTSYDLQGRSGQAPSMATLQNLVENLDTYTDLIRDHSDLALEKNVETLLSKAQALAALAAPTAEPFISEASTAIRAACDFVDDSTRLEAHRTFLRKLVAHTGGGERLSLFTTNYDLAYETALSDLHIAAIDGFGYGAGMKFSGSNFRHDLAVRGQRGELLLDPDVVRLFKLHGSVDWDERPTGIYRSERPANPVLIYPSSNKYQQSYRQPFLEAMSHYQSALRARETTLLIAGFGFNDPHLNQPIVDALMADPTFKVIVAAPDVLTNTNQIVHQLRESVAAGDGRIGLLACKFTELAALLPEPSTADPWRETREALQAIWGKP